MGLRSKLSDAPRSDLLHSLSRAISEMTIRNRSFYDHADAADHLKEGNEAIHRLSGHLRDLLNPDEPLTESRKDGILEQLSLLSPRNLQRILDA